MKGTKMGNGVSLLNFDGVLQKQKKLLVYAGEWIDFSDLCGCRGFCTSDALRNIQWRLRSRKHRFVTLIGSGNYHYVTYALLSEIREPFSLILFDHHTDIARKNGIPLVSCGSWVGDALAALPHLRRVIIIGAHSPDIPPELRLHEKVTVIPELDANRLSAAEIVRAVLPLLPDQPVYLSVDKDVLDREDALTDWDQGSMRLPQLLAVIRELKRVRPLAGADICGELPLSPVDELSAERLRHLRKNETANRAIIDTLLAG